MDILTMITGASVAVDLTGKVAKTAKELSKKMENIETQGLIVELMGDIVNLQAQNTELKSQLLKLQEEQKLKEDLEYSEDGKIMYLKSDEGKRPYCPRCYEVNNKKIGQVTEGNGSIRCPSCNLYGHYVPVDYSLSW